MSKTRKQQRSEEKRRKKSRFQEQDDRTIEKYGYKKLLDKLSNKEL